MSRTQRTRVLGLVALGLGLGLIAGPAPQARADQKQQRHLLELGLFGGVDYLRDVHDLMDVALPHRSYEAASFELGLRLTYLPIPWVGVELEMGIVPTGVEAVIEAKEVSALVYNFRAHLVVQLPVGKRLAPFAVIGGGLLGVSSGNSGVGKDIDGELHWGLGLRYYLSPWAAFRFDVRHLVSDGINGGYANHFSVLAGLSLVLNWKKAKPADADRDGIPDAKDRCPDRAGAAPGGCPDTDGDGVVDPDDRCPTVAARTDDGCPADKDKDGVPDEKDRCPDQAGPAPSGCPDTDGDGVLDPDDKCPKVPARTAAGCPPDQDGDGVPDDKDKCPTVAAKTPDGCPPDRDGDGIPDPLDKCPDQPETRNGYQDEDGCPDELPKEIRRFSGTIQGILFATNSAKILRPSFGILDQAVAMLKKFPTLRLKIRGHTDNQGKLPKNMELSQKRAESVREYFISKGIDGRRLQAEGLGPNEPVADNAKPAGRAKNRRIEFKVVP